ncbi:hypothetical protein ACFYSH_15740 [Streptomyces sp. NPDC005791]
MKLRQKVFGNHPCTRTLLAAVPRLNLPWTSAEPVEACAGLPDCGRTPA